MDKVLKIKGLLAEKKFTQQEFCDKIGISKPTLLNIFNNRSKVDIDMIERIAKVLEVPIGYFFSEDKFGIIQNGTINLNGKNHGSINISDAKHEISILENENEKLKEIISGMKRELELKDQIIELMKESKNLKLMKNESKKKLD